LKILSGKGKTPRNIAPHLIISNNKTATNEQVKKSTREKFSDVTNFFIFIPTNFLLII